MTKLKVCAKMHLFIIISALLIAIGLAVGTICQCVDGAGGFFNYGGEFADYNSITVSYYLSENLNEEKAEAICDAAMKDVSPYHVSYSDKDTGGNGEIVYKFSPSTSLEKLNAVAEEINKSFEGGVLSNASVQQVEVSEGGSKAVTFAAIAAAVIVALQFIYYVIRYKLRAAFSALLANVHAVGVFVALAAITRIPAGAEIIAFGSLVAVITMITSAVFFGKLKKNFANEKYAKTDRVEVVDTTACETRKLTVICLASLAVAVAIFAILTVAVAGYAGVLAPFALAILSLVACAYGCLFFTPAVHSAIDAVCEKVSQNMKSNKKKKPSKTEKAAKLAEAPKEEL